MNGGRGARPGPRAAGAAVLALAALTACGTNGPSGSGQQTSPSPTGADRSASAESGPSPSSRLPLAGRVVVLDPGHNPHNGEHPDRINESVDIGTGRKECDTVGASTNEGYPEAAFTLDVARRARALLTARGATVRLTHDGDRPFGPCVDERARIGNDAHADAVVSVHADGSTAPGARGFHVIVPAKVDDGAADTAAITGPSRRLGTDVAAAFGAETGTRPSTYLRTDDGLVTRDDLGGLNLTRVPKVFVESANLRDARDAARASDPGGRQRAARGVADGLTDFLSQRGS